MVAAFVTLLASLCVADVAVAAPWRLGTGAPGRPAAYPTRVSCVSASQCVAVGSTTSQVGLTVTLGERWDGHRWTLQHTRNARGAQDSQLQDVSCTGSGHRMRCVAVGGFTDRAGDTHPLIERRTRGGWSLQSSPAAVGAPLTGVSCVSRVRCVAVGPDGALWWNGDRWRAQRIPGADAIPAVSCPGRVCVAIVAHDDGWWAARSRGGGWSLRRVRGLDFEAEVEDITCSSSRACIAVGTEDDYFAIVARWDGRRWHFPQVPVPRFSDASDLAGVSCASPRDCLAVGDAVEHWNGRKWSLEQPDRRLPFFTGASCAGNACEVIGYDWTGEAQTPRPLAERKRHDRWSRQRMPVPAAAPAGNLAGVSCPAADACIAIGSVGDSATAERWNGRTWRRLPIPHPGRFETLVAVSCATPTSCTAVGTGNAPIIERWDHNRWRRSRLRHGELLGVSCPSPTACMAVGDRGLGGGLSLPLAARWNGTKWITVAVPIPPPPDSGSKVKLESVSCVSAKACIAVGLANDKTLAEAWDGHRWTIQPTPDREADINALLAVSCTSANACTAVGFSCTGSTQPCDDDRPDRPFNLGARTLAEVWNGVSWTIRPTPNPAHGGAALAGISCTVTDCVAVGSRFAARFDPAVNPFTIGAVEPWVQAGNVAQAVIGSRTSHEQLSSVSCQAAGCTAVGSRITPDNDGVPLIAQGPA